MKYGYLHTLDHPISFLSAFDISGSLFLNKPLWKSGGKDSDRDKLMKDLEKIEEDYRNACQKILKENTP